MRKRVFKELWSLLGCKIRALQSSQVRILIEYNSKYHSRPDNEYSHTITDYIGLAAHCGRENVLREIIATGRISKKDLSVSIVNAVYHGSLETLQILLDAGARIDISQVPISLLGTSNVLDYHKKIELLKPLSSVYRATRK